jgi:hypothetical protein
VSPLRAEEVAVASGLVLTVTEPAAGPAELERLGGLLREELLGLDVADVVRLPGGAAPAGTRGGGASVTGALLVTLPTALPLLTAVVGTVRGWLARSPGRTVRLELDGDVLELTGASAADQRRLVDAWLRRHEPVADGHA